MYTFYQLFACNLYISQRFIVCKKICFVCEFMFCVQIYVFVSKFIFLCANLCFCVQIRVFVNISCICNPNVAPSDIFGLDVVTQSQ